MKIYPDFSRSVLVGGLLVLMLTGATAHAAEVNLSGVQTTSPNGFVIWKNGVAPADFKAAHLGIGTEWRGVRPRRPRTADDAKMSDGPAVTPASPSGRVPGDGGFAGVHFKAEEPVIIDLAPWNALALGANRRAVQRLLGEPSVRLPLKWYYPGDGWLAFDANGTVVGFSLPTPPPSRAPVRVPPAIWAQLRPGMTKAEISTQLGEPEIKLNYKWFYGPDRWIAFDDHGLARGWGETNI
jgi:hypothetical protein